MGTKTSTGTHVLILAGLIMLSYKELNPVLRVCLLFGSEETAWCGHLCVCLLIWAVLQDYKNCLFHAGRTFLNSLLSIFVSSVDVIGIENLPVHGPVILVANHFNQFADGLTVMCACQQRRISFLFARKSYDSLVVGFFARAMEQVPVTRPQDLAFTGSGTLLHLKPDDSAPHFPAAITTSGEGPTVLAGSSHRLVGSDKCKFTTELSEGDKIVFNACGGGGGGGGKHAKKEKATWKVISIESDCACLVSPVVAPTASKSTDTAGPAATKKPAAPSSPQAASPHSPPQKAPNWVTLTTLPADGKYKVLPRGDFGNMLKDVGKALQGGACIGVFPEGGSHDRTDLNELKPGVALMALGAQVPVHIVPVGLSYFRGHQFRSAKVTVHVGPPIMASEREQAEYDAGPGEGRQSACASLLKRIETAMRDVIVPASSFEELQVIHVARRLWYGPDKHKLPPAVRQDLDRRFAFGIKRLVETAPLSEKAFPTVAVDGKRFPAVGGDGTVGSPRPLIVPGLAAAMYPGAAYPEGRDAERRDAELTELVRRLRAYDKELRRLGLRDSQVPSLERAPVMSTLFTLGHMLVMLTISSVPSIILNAPVGLAAIAWAKACQRASLRTSEVKVSGHDVLLSEKMKFAIVGVPLLWLSYAAVLLLATPMRLQNVLTLLMVAPVASYIGVISAESGMIALRDLRPMLMRLFYPSKQVEALKREQLSLRRCVNGEIKRLVDSDERVREVYHKQGELSSDDWERLRK